MTITEVLLPEEEKRRLFREVLARGFKLNGAGLIEETAFVAGRRIAWSAAKAALPRLEESATVCNLQISLDFRKLFTNFCASIGPI